MTLLAAVRTAIAARVAQCLDPRSRAAADAFARAWLALPVRNGRVERLVNAGAVVALRRMRGATCAERRRVRDALDVALRAA